MYYIVLDLEWNQNPNEHQRPNTLLPFEIIEIGAVKLDANRRKLDTFHRLIKPSVYHWIQDSIRQVIHLDYKDLKKGVPFPDAAQDFMEWCGSDYIFCTWAKQDVMELQRNMRYYYLLDLLPGPVVYLDVQKLYSFSFEDGHERRSLKTVIEKQGIPKDQGFHRALGDAVYTARILEQIDPAYLTGYESVDSYQNPKSLKEEFYYCSGGQERYISREFLSRERVILDKEVSRICCPICGELTHPVRLAQLFPFSAEFFRAYFTQGGNYHRTRPRWFQTSAKTYLSLSVCPDHGYVSGKIRVRSTAQEKFYANRILRMADYEEALEVISKIDESRK